MFCGPEKPFTSDVVFEELSRVSADRDEDLRHFRELVQDNPLWEVGHDQGQEIQKSTMGLGIRSSVLVHQEHQSSEVGNRSRLRRKRLEHMIPSQQSNPASSRE